MARKKRGLRPLQDKSTVAFQSAEEAWFWFITSEKARRDGARIVAGFAKYARPCEPDDIYREVIKLYHARRLHEKHLKVLAKYGWRHSPPDKRLADESRDQVLWDEALDRLVTVLVSKDIVVIENQMVSENA